jgi:hypothetical protein
MQDFDEWTFEHGLGVMTANEVRTLNFGNVPTFRGGQNLLANLTNPQANNAEHLLIQHAWFDTTVTPPVIKVMVRNLSSSSVDFGNDQVVIGGWNTNDAG